jgi:hypothetical protein
MLMSDSVPQWEALQNAWHEPGEAPISMDAIRATLRQRRGIRALVVLGELGITAALIGHTAQSVGRGASLLNVVFVSGLWLVWVVATVFAWWNRRGQWRTDVQDARDFLRLSLEHGERKIRVAWFSLGLLLAQVVLGTGVFIASGRMQSDDGMSGRLFALWLILILVTYGSWIAWYFRRARSEQIHFRAMSEALEAAGRDSSATS